ncbi:hypothetical protein [Falsiroseomonas sp.]|uniref:hypothetical protein n=1 Tax=Falsiroseomonas sp. TaxID=2870721 RepID=UPI003563F91A
MYSAVNLSFIDGGKIAYVVRYKKSHAADAEEGGGHSDCILPGGAPVGYFGGGLVNAAGAVFSYSNFLASRPHYVNLSDARGAPCVSTVLVMDVGKARAEAFRKSWLSMRAKTDGFTILGNNCSTHASRACYAAGVTRSPEVSGVDTPTNLYDQIIKASLVPWRSYTGHVGFKPIQSGADELLTSFAVTLEPTQVPTEGGPRKR